LGVVVVNVFESNAEEVRSRLTGLSPGLAIALENLSHIRSLSMQTRIAELKADLAALVRARGGNWSLHGQIVDRLRESIAFENCTLFLMDTATSTLDAVCTRGRQVNLLDHISFDVGFGVAGWVAREAKPFFVKDLACQQTLLDMELVPPPISSFAAAPMMFGETALGVLSISHSRPNAFTEDDVELLAASAKFAGKAIERDAQLNSLEHLAITDQLTGLLNHRYFSTRLESEVKRAKRYNLPLTLLMADIDRFKTVNDQFGHATGNRVLEQVASVVRARVRETDIVARFGGDELAVILCQTGLEDGRVVAERIRSAVENYRVDIADAAGGPVTVSIGLAELSGPNASPARLLEEADAGLYEAKQAGRNRVSSAHGQEAVVLKPFHHAVTR
jgi:diguanylate cyclase (GGDEF)-like protein